MPATDDLPNLFSIEHLAERLGTSARHVRRLVAERRVPYLKVGHFVRFDPVEITAWLDESRVPNGGGQSWPTAVLPESSWIISTDQKPVARPGKGKAGYSGTGARCHGAVLATFWCN